MTKPRYSDPDYHKWRREKFRAEDRCILCGKPKNGYKSKNWCEMCAKHKREYMREYMQGVPRKRGVELFLPKEAWEKVDRMRGDVSRSRFLAGVISGLFEANVTDEASEASSPSSCSRD